MEQANFKSTILSRSSPFRATQLWNEAVSVLQNGMPTRRHFYRMRYYDNCFSGKEAVDWFTRSLTNNPRFGKNVTYDGVCKLLQHFLKTGVFQSVKGSLTFKESGLFEFVDRTIHSPSHKQDNKHRCLLMGLKEINQNIPSELRSHRVQGDKIKPHSPYTSPIVSEKSSYTFSHREDALLDKDISWKDFILKRIQTLLPSLSVELLIDPSTLQSDWVMYNVCPQNKSLRKKTDLPFWVFTAISSVIRPQEKESEYTTYTGFEKDVYTVVRDHLRHRSSPMIPYYLYELFMYTFNHLHYLDLEMKNRSRERDSVENLVLSMSHEWNDENLVDTDDLTRTILPPNSCFETAFTSDEPVTRIVPQSFVDTICLAGYKPSRSLSNANLVRTLSRCEDLVTARVSPTPLPSPHIEKPVINKYRNRKRTSYLRRTQSMAQIDANAKSHTLPLPVSSAKNKRTVHPQQQSYVNYGLSQSMDDLLVLDDNMGLDFEEAMQSVNCLLRACGGPGSDQVSNIHEVDFSSLESLSTVNSCPQSKATLVCIDSCLWYEDIQDVARQVFQSLLMLMPPVSRTSLRMLLQFIDKLPVPSYSTITKTEMVYDLSAHILSPGLHSKNVYSHHMVLSVVYFLVDNCEYIFEDIPDRELPRYREEKVQDHKETQEQRVFCEQLTKHQFEDQGVTSSWFALAELLDQIINDKKMKRKEKKKRLKKFKEAYPHIYKQRFGDSSSNLPGLVHFR